MIRIRHIICNRCFGEGCKHCRQTSEWLSEKARQFGSRRNSSN